MGHLDRSGLWDTLDPRECLETLVPGEFQDHREIRATLVATEPLESRVPSVPTGYLVTMDPREGKENQAQPDLLAQPVPRELEEKLVMLVL